MKNFILLLIIFISPSVLAEVNSSDYLIGQKSSSTALKDIYQKSDSNFSDIKIFSKSKLIKIEDDKFSKTRGAADAILYKKWSPSVVLIVTDDALGSGAVISADGKIITNWHVVKNSQTVGIIFKPIQEGKAVTKDDVKIAKVIRVDEISDLALLKIDSLPASVAPLRLGNETDIGVGLDVHAIGHPKGQSWSYTKGVISQFRSDYSWSTSESTKHKASVIQTQTPINPGNSGGPLILNNGLIVGINSFKSSESEALNFAVSVEEVKKLLNSTKDRFLAKLDKPKCEPKTLFEGRNEKNTADVFQMDTNCSGKINLVFALPDDKQKPLIMFLHTKSEKIPDGMVLSYKRDFKFWDLSFWDENLTEAWPVVGLHKNGEAVPYKLISREEYEKSVSK
jgi:S1-C subfamily serine protease